MCGDAAAANLVLKVINRRYLITGFDKIDDDLTGTARTIVIGGTSEQYIAGRPAIARPARGPR